MLSAALQTRGRTEHPTSHSHSDIESLEILLHLSYLRQLRWVERLDDRSPKPWSCYFQTVGGLLCRTFQLRLHSISNYMVCVPQERSNMDKERRQFSWIYYIGRFHPLGSGKNQAIHLEWLRGTYPSLHLPWAVRDCILENTSLSYCQHTTPPVSNNLGPSNAYKSYDEANPTIVEAGMEGCIMSRAYATSLMSCTSHWPPPGPCATKTRLMALIIPTLEVQDRLT